MLVGGLYPLQGELSKLAEGSLILFVLSSFPPTERLGLVCAGAAITDLVVLVVLPAVVTGRAGRSFNAGERSILISRWPVPIRHIRL